ncbi:vWA domain-containing protein [Galbibacter pacificus]|uniref:von Willebrand factor type A domain-containing protein n=1 Tax=Galbibacter pacificus TaxID=2996052 RepID=A0ABT6FME8_9FLAO|nr:von Willebrand factor type A domain-containing protein [Galbibacter pacificus]MDG3580778.1 von Willebrand factor type A domain-containing protein [Galbibacter pacificus]MDG3584256.1 von Willebrand factor type A domain-containing protein [Galbibacter pacificus]
MRSLYILLFILSTTWATAQTRQITGTVTDASDGSPIPGVNIINTTTNASTATNYNGRFSIAAKTGDVLSFSFLGMKPKKVSVKEKSKELNIQLEPSGEELEEIMIVEDAAELKKNMNVIRGISTYSTQIAYPPSPQANTESYTEINERGFQQVTYKPLSTFSIDVDKASYSNMRRMINNGEEIPKDAIKIEELINYFKYEYKQPTGDDPFSIETTLNKTPWNEQHELIKIGIQGKNVPLDNIPPSNLVFLIDVSGSMQAPNKLPLLKSAFKLLVGQLRPKDRVSVVVYAGAAGLVLPPTPGSDKNKIIEALDKLEAGGSTAGSKGLQLAYETAQENFIKKGNNRVILATDGDFNIGPSSDREMEDLIEEKRKSGVFLTCLGFGMGNYKDSKLETLADKGNGNHAYIDTMQEAQRVLGTEFGGTLYTIAKDVKIQVEFNPEKIQAYRLIGYENRLLNDEDFKDDTKDAGELGSGHTVSALYELIPEGIDSPYLKDIDSLKYTKTTATNTYGNELLTVKFRYKKPDGDTSKEIVHPVNDKPSPTNVDFNFASAVAMWGMYLRDSEYLNGTTKEQIVNLAENNKGVDKEGYRAEFVRLMKSYNRF